MILHGKTTFVYHWHLDTIPKPDHLAFDNSSTFWILDISSFRTLNVPTWKVYKFYLEKFIIWHVLFKKTDPICWRGRLTRAWKIDSLHLYPIKAQVFEKKYARRKHKNENLTNILKLKRSLLLNPHLSAAGFCLKWFLKLWIKSTFVDLLSPFASFKIGKCWNGCFALKKYVIHN